MAELNKYNLELTDFIPIYGMPHLYKKDKKRLFYFPESRPHWNRADNYSFAFYHLITGFLPATILILEGLEKLLK